MTAYLKNIEIKVKPDEHPDISYFGEYTDKPDEWAICRHCGEYLHNAEKGERIAELIQERIEELEEDIKRFTLSKRIAEYYENLIQIMENVINEKFEEHDCPHYHREYNYFKPEARGEKEGSPEYQEYGKRDFERMENLNNGEWSFIGIVAVAEVRTLHSENPRTERVHEITSGGIWGVESDSGEYLLELAQEELDDLKSELEQFGIKMGNFDYLAKKALKTFEENEV